MLDPQLNQLEKLEKLEAAKAAGLVSLRLLSLTWSFLVLLILGHLILTLLGLTVSFIAFA